MSWATDTDLAMSEKAMQLAKTYAVSPLSTLVAGLRGTGWRAICNVENPGTCGRRLQEDKTEASLISDALVAQLDLSPSGGPPISDETLEKIDLNWYNPYPELATGGDGAEGEALALLMRQYQTQVAATQLAAVLTAVWKKQQVAVKAPTDGGVLGEDGRRGRRRLPRARR